MRANAQMTRTIGAIFNAMSTAPDHIPSRDVDHRDDYRNGFMDALMYHQGIRQPTAAQIAQVVAVLIRFRADPDAARSGAQGPSGESGGGSRSPWITRRANRS